MDINFHHHTVTLLPSGGCYIHESDALVVADLHLGKGVLLQEAGVPLMNQIDYQTVEKLKNDLRKFNPKLCIICGDLIHAMSPRIIDQLLWFEKELDPFITEFIVTIGNHDSTQLSKNVHRLKCHATFLLDNIYYSHYEIEGKPSISGHIHPGIKVNKGRIRKYFKSFIKDDLNITCPSYGRHTGMFTQRKKHKQYYIIDGDNVKEYF